MRIEEKTSEDINDDGDSISCCSSSLDPDDITVMGNIEQEDSKNKGRKASSFLAFRNCILVLIAGMGVVLTVGAHICLSHLGEMDEATMDKLPAIFTAIIITSFSLVAILVHFFSRHAGAMVNGQQVDETYSLFNFLFPTSGTTSSRASITKNDFRGSVAAPTEGSFGTEDGTVLPTTVANSENLHDFLGNCQRESALTAATTTHQGKPIAELFMNTSVLFADIEGFTAWSSVREPQSVFMLLETLYHAFDTLAHRRKVFKVETVGDCYVAVTGLPAPRKDHAVVMARFARDCLKRMRPLVKKLEVQLGPDTGDLKIRIGIHSGPVTGGVLRGERARFQLFGDTVNTASRIESTGQGGQIHISNTTAELLKQAGKSQWISMRPTKVIAKGKGAMQTYWLNPKSNGSDAHSSVSGFSMSSGGDDSDCDDSSISDLPGISGSSLAMAGRSLSQLQTNKLGSAKKDRLVSWNVDMLHRLLKQIVARRQCLLTADPNRKADADESIFLNREGSLLDEVKESIPLPSFNYSRTAAEEAQSIQLDAAVFDQLQDYVSIVAEMYTGNPFHNFEHASHVTMSVAKLLGRIVAPSAREFDASVAETGSALHDHTYGITSDPLTQFACVLSALIHDADHPGVPNTQLVKENAAEAERYKGKSVAEQNSVDRCWNLLMESQFAALRKTIYTTTAGLRRFRSLVVNSVLATDICDPDLKNLRNTRWDRAFNKNGTSDSENSTKAANDRKATIVIEHLIQASDVAHTMQHWHIYRKWNERLFRECYKAFKEGRATKNPSEFWYEGEKGFYDFYIIPLAKKLKECGVFGVSSSEYLDYSLRNREEWEAHGQEAVAEMVAKVKFEESHSGEQ